MLILYKTCTYVPQHVQLSFKKKKIILNDLKLDFRYAFDLKIKNISVLCYVI